MPLGLSGLAICPGCHVCHCFREGAVKIMGGNYPLLGSLYLAYQAWLNESRFRNASVWSSSTPIVGMARDWASIKATVSRLPPRPTAFLVVIGTVL